MASMGISSKKKKLLLIGLIFPLLLTWLILSLPNAYFYESEKRPYVHYINIFEESVIFIDIDPDCTLELREVEPSPGFGVAYGFCDKRDLSSMEIESVTQDEEWKTYTLKYSHSEGERGDYRVTLVQTPEAVVYQKNTYTKSSSLGSLLHYIFAK